MVCLIPGLASFPGSCIAPGNKAIPDFVLEPSPLCSVFDCLQHAKQNLGDRHTCAVM